MERVWAPEQRWVGLTVRPTSVRAWALSLLAALAPATPLMLTLMPESQTARMVLYFLTDLIYTICNVRLAAWRRYRQILRPQPEVMCIKYLDGRQ